MQFDPKATLEYIETTVNLEAIKKVQSSCEVLTVLDKQRELEMAVLVATSKITILEDMLKEQRDSLSKYAIEAAINKERLMMILNNIPVEGQPK